MDESSDTNYTKGTVIVQAMLVMVVLLSIRRTECIRVVSYVLSRDMRRADDGDAFNKSAFPMHSSTFIYGIIAVSSLLGPGMSMGYSSVALPLLKNATAEPILSEDQCTWFASIAMISTPVGCIVSLFTMKVGRRFAMGSSGIVCSVGWIIIATSYSVNQLLIGRCVTGFATGLASTPACVYVAEIAMPYYRAMLTTCTSFFISIGIMLIYLLGFIIKNDWRFVATISILIPAISAFLNGVVMPESPRWLLNRGRKDAAKKSLLKLRYLKSENDTFAKEFAAMVSYSEPRNDIELSNRQSRITIDESINAKFENLQNVGKIRNRRFQSMLICENLKNVFKTLTIPQVWKPLVILNIFFFFQQFCGIYVLMAYAVDLISKTGVTNDPFFITAVIGLVQIIGAFCLVLCSARLGKRPIALISGSGMTLSLASLGIYNQFFEQTKLSGIPLTCIFLFVATGSFGFLALPWSMIGELYPTRFVNVLGPTTSCIAGLFNFATVQIYPRLIQFGAITMIYTYCGITLIATIFVALFLPETRGKSKDEIERKFQKSYCNN